MNKWPKQNYDSMVQFYGPVGENQTQIVLPYEMYLAWDSTAKVKKVTCNEKCSKSLHSIFEKTLKTYGLEDIKKLKLDCFGGCLNVRKMTYCTCLTCARKVEWVVFLLGGIFSF